MPLAENNMISQMRGILVSAETYLPVNTCSLTPRMVGGRIP